VPGLLPFDNGSLDAQPAYYKVGFRYDAGHFGLGRERFVAALRAEGIAADAGFHALHVGRSPSRFRKGSDLAEAEGAGHAAVVLHHPILLGNENDVGQVALAVRKLKHFAKQLSIG
jgi:hypothetical protein